MFKVSIRHLAAAIFAIPRARRILLGEEVESSEEEGNKEVPEVPQPWGVSSSKKDSKAVEEVSGHAR